jgi:hypothetical protein
MQIPSNFWFGNYRAGPRRKRGVSPAIVALLCCALLPTAGCWVKVPGGGADALYYEKKLHEQMASGDLAGIYNSVHQSYRDATTRETSDALFSAIARKLGSPLECNPGNASIKYSDSETTMESVCFTKFSRNATATETFIWQKSGDKFELVNYTINSHDLVIR